MHIWPETDGGRGSEDIASCIFKFVNEEKADDAKHVIAFSDTCGGQNRNFNIAAMWLYCIIIGKAELIDHKFMYSGHSFLPNDREYGSIEQKKRQVGMIYVPEDWHNLVRAARRQNPLVVKEISLNDTTFSLNARCILTFFYLIQNESYKYTQVPLITFYIKCRNKDTQNVCSLIRCLCFTHYPVA